MLVAQAQAEQLRLVTADRAFASYRWKPYGEKQMRSFHGQGIGNLRNIILS